MSTVKRGGGRIKQTKKKMDGPRGNASLGKAESVKKAIRILEKKLADGDLKPTVGEYVRLLELQKEIDADAPREIKVTWVEPGETESSSEE
jgi:hypothetical protein